MKYVNVCPVCGSQFTADRSDARTCSTTCRHIVWREQRRQKKLMEKFSFDLFEQARFQRINDFSPTAGVTIRNILKDEGKNIAVLAMKAVEQAILECDKRGLETGYVKK